MATNLLLEGDDLEALLIKAHSEGGPSARIVRADKYRHGGLWGFFARERFEVAVEIPELPARSQVTGPSAFFLPDADAEPALPAIATTGAATTGAATTNAATTNAATTGAATGPAVPAQRRPGRHAGPPVSTPAASTPSITPASSAAPTPSVAPASSEATAAYTATVAAAQARTGYRYAAPSTTPSVAPVDSLLGLADRVSASEQAAVRACYAGLDDALVLPDGAEARSHHEIDLLARELAQIALGGAVHGLSSATPGPTPGPTAAATAGQPEAAGFGSGSSRRSTSGHADVPTDSTVIPSMSSSRPAATGQAGSTDARRAGRGGAPTGRPAPIGDTLADDLTARGPADAPARGEAKPPGGDGADRTDGAVDAQPSPVRSSTTRPEFTALLDTLRSDRPVGAARTPAGTPARGSRAHEAAPLRTTSGDADVTAPFALRFDLAPETDLGSAPAPDLTFDVMPPVARPTSGVADHAAGRAPVPAQTRTDRPNGPVPPAPPAHQTQPAQQAQPAKQAQPAQPSDPAPRVPAQANPRTGPRPAQQVQQVQQQVAPHEADDESPEVGQRRSDKRAAADRRALRALGVPAAWTRRLRPGDRFGEVLRMLERMPSDDIDPATAMVAVVGPRSSVRMEAHRTALDLATGDDPRPVVVVPAAVGPDRAAAVARALRIGSVVLAVESDGEEASVVLDTLTTVQAGAVIAIVDAAAPLERTQRWLDALGQVDALVLDGAAAAPDPAAVLQLGLPVVRLDGIPIDRVTWTALLCAQLLAADAADAAADAARACAGAAGSGARSRSGSRSGADAGSRAGVVER